jgi:hypothetical protein
MTARTVVSHALAFLLGLLAAGGVGLWAVWRERDRTAEAREEAAVNLARAMKAEGEAKADLRTAEANLALAKKAVDDCFAVAKDHPLMKQERPGEELQETKRALLEKALPFYRHLRALRQEAECLDLLVSTGLELDRLKEAERREQDEALRERLRQLLEKGKD